MQGVEVYLNNHKVCRAGIENDGLLMTLIDWIKRKDELDMAKITVSGSNSGGSEFITWFDEELKAGDEIRIKLIKQGEIDKPVKVSPRVTEADALQSKLDYFHQLKAELKDYL